MNLRFSRTLVGIHLVGIFFSQIHIQTRKGGSETMLMSTLKSRLGN